jgi:hypothetical protein
MASGSASTSYLGGNGSNPAQRKSVGSFIREISMTEHSDREGGNSEDAW